VTSTGNTVPGQPLLALIIQSATVHHCNTDRNEEERPISIKQVPSKIFSLVIIFMLEPAFVHFTYDGQFGHTATLTVHSFEGVDSQNKQEWENIVIESAVCEQKQVVLSNIHLTVRDVLHKGNTLKMISQVMFTKINIEQITAQSCV
jgi:hypothetical protein